MRTVPSTIFLVVAFDAVGSVEAVGSFKSSSTASALIRRRSSYIRAPDIPLPRESKRTYSSFLILHTPLPLITPSARQKRENEMHVVNTCAYERDYVYVYIQTYIFNYTCIHIHSFLHSLTMQDINKEACTLL